MVVTCLVHIAIDEPEEIIIVLCVVESSSRRFSSCCYVRRFYVFYFFSSRRRHTRYWRDWSSDVCSSDLLVVRLLQGHGRRAQGAALALYEPALRGVGLDHHRELEPVALGGERSRLLLPCELLALDPQRLLQLADPAPHLEPAARGKAQVGPLVRVLDRVDPRAPEPGLQDLVPELVWVL